MNRKIADKSIRVRLFLSFIFSIFLHVLIFLDYRLDNRWKINNLYENKESGRHLISLSGVRILNRGNIFEKNKVTGRELNRRKIQPNGNILSKKKQTKQLARDGDAKADAYFSYLVTTIDRAKKYPSLSRRLQEQGNIMVAFRLDKEGEIVDLKINAGNAPNRLVQATSTLFQSIGRFKAPPKAILEDGGRFEIEVSYELP